MPASIDPREWLEGHHPGPFPEGALEAGIAALNEHLEPWTALSVQPELRLEIVLAWLLAEAHAAGCERMERRIRQIADAMDAMESV